MDEIERLIGAIIEGRQIQILYMGRINLEDFFSLQIGLRDLLKSFGAKLTLGSLESYKLVTEQSPYEQFEGTPFETTTHSLEPSENIPTYTRKEIYELIDRRVTPAARQKIRQKFDGRFTEKVWGGIVPLTGIMRIFINEHLDDLV